MKHARSLDLVDAALETARRAGGEARLPAALRARILAAARPVAAPAPRGRLVDLAVRALAVAASIAAVLFAMPLDLEAAEFDAQPLVDFNERLATSVADHIPGLGFDATRIPVAAGGSALAPAAAAIALVGVAAWLARGERRR